MLETDEVDQDYFTPAASTTLANLFDNSSKPEEKSNNSLKYPPPKPQVQKLGISDDKVGLAPIFKCSLIGHQWMNKVYSPKGKIGCSILKVTKDPKREGELLMVLFNSSKQTLSSISLTPKLQITVKDLDVISFYENCESYWCLYGSPEDISHLLNYYKSKNVQLIVSKNDVSSPPETTSQVLLNDSKNDKSDVDTATDVDETGITKTKASIISRMANMGKAVLPKPASNNDSTSSSEEEYDDKKKINEFERVIPKRHLVAPKINVLEQNKTKQSFSTQIDADTGQPTNVLANNDDLLVALRNINLDSAVATNNVNLFFTEQRISNSELRINVNRINDKVDKILNLIDGDNKTEGRNINTEILIKLLKEYENKIKTYEELLKEKTTIKPAIEKPSLSLNNREENILMHDKILNLQTTIEQKDNELSLLYNEIKVLKHSNDVQLSNKEENGVAKYSEDLEQLLAAKNVEIEKLTKENDKFTAENSALISSQVKQIMNDTFHGIVANFKENENYSGEDIRLIVGKVIKNVTLEALK